MRIADAAWIPVVVLTFVGYASGAPTDVQVNCAQGKSINDAISKMDDSTKDYTLTLSGACAENVSIRQFEGHSLILQGDGNASTSLTGVSSNLPGTAVLQVVSSQVITIQNLTIHVTGNLPTGQVSAISIVFCQRCNVLNVNITTPRAGIGVSDSQGVIANVSVTIDAGGTGSGVSVVNASDMNLLSLQLHGSAGLGTGIFVDSSSHARLGVNGSTASPGAFTVDGFGIGITVRGNSYIEGSTTCPQTFQNPPQTPCGNVSGTSQAFRLEASRAFLTGINISANVANPPGGPPNGALLVGTESTLEMIAPVNISNSLGIGLIITHNSHAALFGNLFGLTINGAAPRAVSVGALSSIQFNGPVTINGSGVNCDALSEATGTGGVGPAGVAINCANQSGNANPLP